MAKNVDYSVRKDAPVIFVPKGAYIVRDVTSG
jgi:hypothetical protein